MKRVAYCHNTVHSPIAIVSDKIEQCKECNLMMIDIGWFEDGAGNEGNGQDEATIEPTGTGPVA